ncbi:HIAT1 [Bugula neritina]|uniref:HIAT1 n=1 Tax=Bugula neritina TaxID=10212 RepID=A0A7J7JWW4_BUGNE|nr:HIAT1 [Bugula neritina]
MISAKRTKRVVGSTVRGKRMLLDDSAKFSESNIKPSVYHALVVIFLEFFAWGLLTTPTISGILSFLSAPLVGAMSDTIGRKPFLILTVACTCAPIPFMMISPWWYFALISLSGAFAVTFSVVFAYAWQT